MRNDPYLKSDGLLMISRLTARPLFLNPNVFFSRAENSCTSNSIISGPDNVADLESDHSQPPSKTSATGRCLAFRTTSQ